MALWLHRKHVDARVNALVQLPCPCRGSPCALLSTALPETREPFCSAFPFPCKREGGMSNFSAFAAEKYSTCHYSFSLPFLPCLSSFLGFLPVSDKLPGPVIAVRQFRGRAPVETTPVVLLLPPCAKEDYPFLVSAYRVAPLSCVA